MCVHACACMCAHFSIPQLTSRAVLPAPFISAVTIAHLSFFLKSNCSSARRSCIFT